MELCNFFPMAQTQVPTEPSDCPRFIISALVHAAPPCHTYSSKCPSRKQTPTPTPPKRERACLPFNLYCTLYLRCSNQESHVSWRHLVDTGGNKYCQMSSNFCFRQLHSSLTATTPLSSTVIPLRGVIAQLSQGTAELSLPGIIRGSKF